MEAHLPSNGEECGEGKFDVSRFSVGGSEKSMVGIYDGPIDRGVASDMVN